MNTFKLRSMRVAVMSATLAATLAGCSLMPVYERPASPVPAAWPQDAAAAPDTTAVPDIAWRDFFDDLRLRDLIGLALANNRELRVAALNILSARAQYGIERAAQFPALAANAGGSASGGASLPTTRQYTVGLGVAAYELDLFGRVRSLSEAALQTYLSTEEARNTAQIALVAEVANAWLALQADQERLALARQTLVSQQRSLELSERRLQAGAGAGADVYRARTSVESARADVAAYTSQIALDLNALTLLVGSAPPAATLPAAPQPAGAEAYVGALPLLPAGLPSDLLQRRPDVRGAERSLRAANANIGAARAAFFPRIALTGSAGTGSSSLSGLFESGSSAWSFAPSISLPIFDGGANQARLDVAKVGRDVQVARYELSIQTAFREVADALAQRGTLDERMAAQLALVDAADKTYRIDEARYRNGADTYQNALLSQRSLYAAQQGLISLRLSRQTNLVTLYKVLGGGWQA